MELKLFQLYIDEILFNVDNKEKIKQTIEKYNPESSLKDSLESYDQYFKYSMKKYTEDVLHGLETQISNNRKNKETTQDIYDFMKYLRDRKINGIGGLLSKL